MSIKMSIESAENFPVPRTIIGQHLREEQTKHPEATGALSEIVRDLEIVAKKVSYTVSTAGIAEVYGATGQTNIHGENVLKLDEQANILFKDILRANPNIAGFASEEEDDFVTFPNGEDRKYIIWFDPLDGSSNFDVNVSIGSIFSIYKRLSESGVVTQKDFLQKGDEQVCAGYFLYGSSTMFVYTTGDGVHGFTLDPSFGEFVLSAEHTNINTPETGKTYSVNESYSDRWDLNVASYVQYLKSRDASRCSARYIGSLVADFHRNLLKGGVFLYPADKGHPDGKLRLNCELNPLAFIAEQAGGAATNGTHRILDLKPHALHQRSPIIIGSRKDVELFNKFLQAE